MTETKHTPKYVESSGLLDQWECSCGWKSEQYFDGSEYGYQDFLQHKNDAISKAKRTERK